MTDLPRTPQHVEGFALGRLIAPVAFELRSAGPQEGQYDPRPRYADGTLVNGGFKTGANRGRPKGTGTGLGIGHSKEAKEEMVQRYKAGEGLNPLAAAFSTTAQRVREIVRQAGVEIRGTGYCRKVEPVVEVEPILEPVMPDLPVELERETSRSEAMKNNKLTPEQVDEMIFLRGDKKPVREIAEQFGVVPSVVYYHISMRKANTATITAPPSPAMDDPTPDAAAIRHEQTEPATEAVVQQAWKEMQERARQLRERVIAVQDLPPVTLRPYSPPAVIFDGILSDLVRPQNVTAVARTVTKLVEAMNAIPGVRADFGFVMEMSAGVRP